jgi:UDP-N-acetyl-2-amino-2-deoxyglucuronate dehydrogenase
MSNFALIGAAGFVAPRHMKAIRDTGNRLVAAVDPHDSVGVLDSFFPEARFFTEIERFDRHIEKLRRRGDGERVHYVSVCTPNYLHDAHVRLALRVHAHAICEKPLVISPWNLDQLAEIEQETGCRVYSVLQLRLLPPLRELREQVARWPAGRRAEVELSYVTRRGSWYQTSWKGSEERSGGLAMNIGVHFFDLLGWIFGAVHDSELHMHSPERMAGAIEMERARVRWLLSVDAADLPDPVRAAGGHAWRSLTMDGQAIEFSEGFTDLHTRVYQDVLAGGGFGIADARPAIELVNRIRSAEVTAPRLGAHGRLASR